jgi:hypothetical protein
MGVGSDAKDRVTKSTVTLERIIVDSSDGSVIRTRFRAWSSVAVVVIVVVVVVVVGGCCCWQLLRPFSLIEKR